MTQYLVELYVSRMGAGGLPEAAARAREVAEQLTGEGVAVRYVRSIFVPEDETWLLLYEGATTEAVEAALARAALSCERVLEAVTQP